MNTPGPIVTDPANRTLFLLRGRETEDYLPRTLDLNSLRERAEREPWDMANRCAIACELLTRSGTLIEADRREEADAAFVDAETHLSFDMNSSTGFGQKIKIQQGFYDRSMVLAAAHRYNAAVDQFESGDRDIAFNILAAAENTMRNVWFEERLRDLYSPLSGALRTLRNVVE